MLFEGLAPPGVVVREKPVTDDDGGLHPGEAELVAGAVASRRGGFAAGRRAARAALVDVGAPTGPLLRDPRGGPAWPDGVVGSITHSDTRAAAVVGTRPAAPAGLGIDVEPHAPLPDGVLDVVASGAERDHLRRLAAEEPAVAWDRLLFCAKECTFKVWSPLRGTWLGFEDAAVDLRPDGTWTTTLLGDRALPDDAAIRGRWAVRDGLIGVLGWAAPGGGPLAPPRR